MNGRNNFFNSRKINTFIEKHKTSFIHHAVRLCSCGTQPGCNFCRGMGYYFVKAKKFTGIIRYGEIHHSNVGDNNWKESKSVIVGSPALEAETYKIWAGATYSSFDKYDILVPLQARWQINTELVRISSSRTSLFPSKIEGPLSFTDVKYGELVEYWYGKDFIFKERDIIFKTPPPSWATRFSLRYWGVPEFVVWEHVTPSTENGETLWCDIIVKKRTLPPADQEIGRGAKENPFAKENLLGNF